MIEISYKLVGTGWAECKVTDENKQVTVTASYLSDALGALSEAVLNMMTGVHETRASFDEEPGEYRWVFTRQNDSDDKVHLQIIEFTELWSGKPDEDGAVIFESSCSADQLGKAMVTCLDAVKDIYGDAGYKEKWVEHEFPSKTHAQLKKYL